MAQIKSKYQVKINTEQTMWVVAPNLPRFGRCVHSMCASLIDTISQLFLFAFILLFQAATKLSGRIKLLELTTE